MSIAAIALGANIIERHFTDSRYREGPDISCSMDPSELRFLIDRSKEIIYQLIMIRREQKKKNLYINLQGDQLLPIEI